MVVVAVVLAALPIVVITAMIPPPGTMLTCISLFLRPAALHAQQACVQEHVQPQNCESHGFRRTGCSLGTRPKTLASKSKPYKLSDFTKKDLANNELEKTDI